MAIALRAAPLLAMPTKMQPAETPTPVRNSRISYNERLDPVNISLRPATIILAVLLLAGCAVSENLGDTVSARSDRSHVTITNGTDDQIYFVLFGRSLSALIDWVPHLDDERSVAAGESLSIRHADIMMEEDETQVVLFWWNAEVREGKRVPGRINTMVIDL